jgi:AcrR family transcriptional regulator
MYTQNMPRTYTLKRRAEQQSETRQRIVDAAVALHGEIGPARSSLSQVAERAGVQRNTLYAHFPDERSLLLACSGQTMERDPLPSADGLRGLPDGEARLRTGLAALYGWYARNAAIAGCVLRDAQVSPLVQEITALRFGEPMAALESALARGLLAPQRALLRLALEFATWRSLAQDSRLKPAAAVDAMVRAILGASGRGGQR